MVKPGEALYVPIEDIKKESATVYTKTKSGDYESAGTLSKKGVSRHSGSGRKRITQAELIAQGEAEKSKIKAAEENARLIAEAETARQSEINKKLKESRSQQVLRNKQFIERYSPRNNYNENKVIENLRKANLQVGQSTIKTKNKWEEIKGKLKKPETYTTPEGVKFILGDLPAEAVYYAGGQIDKAAFKTGIISKESFIAKPLNFPRIKDKSLQFSPVTESEAKSTLSNLFLFSAFSPYMKTATAQQTSEYTEVTTQEGKKIFIKKSQLQDFLESQVREQRGKNIIIRDPTFTEKANRIQTLIKNLKNPRDPVAVEKVLKIAEQSYGKSFVKEFTSQEGINFIAKPITKTSNSIKPTTQGGVKVANLEEIQYIETSVTSVSKYAGKGQYEKTNWVGGFNFQSKSDILGIKKEEILDTRQSTVDLSKLEDIEQDNKVITSLGSGHKPSSKQSPDVSQDLGQDTSPDVINISIQKPKPRQDLTSGLDFLKARRWKQPEPKKLDIKIPIFSPVIKSLAKKVEQGELFNIFTKQKGKAVKVGTAITQEEAFTKLKSSLSKGLEASGFVEKGGKKVNLPTILGGEFRESKITKGILVEEKSKRLRKGSTGKEIQYFRKKVGGKKQSSFLFGF